jgi:hypothetical protein
VSVLAFQNPRRTKDDCALCRTQECCAWHKPRMGTFGTARRGHRIAGRDVRYWHSTDIRRRQRLSPLSRTKRTLTGYKPIKDNSGTRRHLERARIARSVRSTGESNRSCVCRRSDRIGFRCPLMARTRRAAMSARASAIEGKADTVRRATYRRISQHGRSGRELS